MPILTSTISNGNTTSPLGAHLRHAEGYDENTQTLTGLDLSDYDILFIDEDDDETIPASQIMVTQLGREISAQEKFEELDETDNQIVNALEVHTSNNDIHTSLVQKIKYATLEVDPGLWEQESETIWSIPLDNIKKLPYKTTNTLIDVLYSESAIKMLEESGMTTLYADNRNGKFYLCLVGDGFEEPSEPTIINIKYYDPIIL